MQAGIGYLLCGVTALAIGIGVGCGQIDSATTSHIDLTMEGWKLSPEAAAGLEARLEMEPQDIASRIKLLGYYSKKRYEDSTARERHANHMLWLIEHQPEEEVLGSAGEMDPGSVPEAYVQAKALWRQHLEGTHKENPQVLRNAAGFFMIWDHELSESYLKQGLTLQPENPEWYEELARLYGFDALDLDGKVDVEAAKKSFEMFEAAFERTPERSRQYLREDAAKAALFAGHLDKAREYAKDMLAANTNKNDWNYGNAIHHANLVLGHIALQEGKPELAEEYLLKAGDTPGSPQLDSFGPNMLLARKLLEQGRKEAVIEYLRRCGKFWDEEQAAKWIRVVESGDIPEFQGNLSY